MKKFLTLTAISVVLACAAVPAMAQTYTSPVGVSLRIGIAEPTEADTVNNSSSTWFAAGFDYKLSGLKLKALPHGYFSVSLDYAGKGQYRTAPLLFNYTSGKIVYASVGAGVTFARFPQDDGTINDKVRFSYSGAIGYNFSNGQVPLFLEARYFGSEMPRVADVAFYIGARF